MLNLINTSSKLTVTTASAGTIRMSASWVDWVSSASITPGGVTDAVISTATTADVVPVPGAATIRNVKRVNISNTDAAVTNLITVTQTDGTNTDVIWKGTLLVGERVSFDETGAFIYYGADGVQKASTGSGQLVKITYVTSGTSYTVGSTTRSIDVEAIGGGGGGGGCTSVAAAASAGGGGGSGGYLRKVYTCSPNQVFTVAIGALGAGVSGAAGGAGGNTTITDGTTLCTARGGSGGAVATALTTLSAYAGAAGGAVSTGGDLNDGGAPGGNGVVVVVATPVGTSGEGGSNQYGAGGAPIAAVGNGNNGTGFGGGGGGALTGASVARVGGSGTAGVLVIREFT